jgi:hypothetical protein
VRVVAELKNDGVDLNVVKKVMEEIDKLSKKEVMNLIEDLEDFECI